MVYAGRRLPDVQVYKVRKTDEYLLTFGPPYIVNGAALLDYVGALYPNEGEETGVPTLASGQASVTGYVNRYCRPVPWSRVSPRWQEAFAPHLDFMLTELSQAETK